MSTIRVDHVKYLIHARGKNTPGKVLDSCQLFFAPRVVSLIAISVQVEAVEEHGNISSAARRNFANYG
jgi:hypothetical protein